MALERDRAWLIPLADMSLLLFVLTAAALRPGDQSPETKLSSQEIVYGAASEIFVAMPDGPSFSDWLAAYDRSENQRLTIVANYTTPTELGAVQIRASELGEQAIASGFAPRIVVQQASDTAVTAVFAHDQEPGLAQLLQ